MDLNPKAIVSRNVIWAQDNTAILKLFSNFPAAFLIKILCINIVHVCNICVKRLSLRLCVENSDTHACMC